MLNSMSFYFEQNHVRMKWSVVKFNSYSQVTASDFAECNGCNQCVSTNFCTTCQYWPIYPCYSTKRPMVDCVAAYDNDKIAVSDPDTLNTAINMYETLMNEGHDARLLRFSASDDGTINGKFC